MTPDKKRALKLLVAGALAFLFFRHASARADDKITPDTPQNNLTLNLTDVFGEALKTTATVRICHSALPDCRNIETNDRELMISDLPAGLEKPYSIKIAASAYEDFYGIINVLILTYLNSYFCAVGFRQPTGSHDFFYKMTQSSFLFFSIFPRLLTSTCFSNLFKSFVVIPFLGYFSQ